MRIGSLFLFVFFCVGLTHAHEVNEAFFWFYQKGSTVEVKVELPWTMRNALLQYNPALEKSTDTKDFEETFVEYIKENLVLKDSDGAALRYEEYEALEDKGHSHQSSYLIRFKGARLSEVTNTIMFALYENQVNYNMTGIDLKKVTYKTKRGVSSFKLKGDTNSNYKYLFLLFVPALYFAYRFRNRSQAT